MYMFPISRNSTYNYSANKLTNTGRNITLREHVAETMRKTVIPLTYNCTTKAHTEDITYLPSRGDTHMNSGTFWHDNNFRSMPFKMTHVGNAPMHKWTAFSTNQLQCFTNFSLSQHTKPFYGPFSGTIWGSRYQKKYFF